VRWGEGGIHINFVSIIECMRARILLLMIFLVACAPASLDCPEAKYVSRDVEECKLVMFLCAEGEPFYNECGCGCTVEEPEA